MTRNPFRYALIAALSAGALAATPATADQVLSMLSHNDEVVMMGHKTPAQDVTHEYWFGEKGVRYELGETSVILRPDLKKVFMINHTKKTYSPIDLPIDFKSLVGPDMAPMMDQMMRMMQATSKVTPSDRTGQFAGFNCKYTHVDVSMAMMQLSMDECLTKDLPIDYSRYKALAESQAEMTPNTQWMKELAEKLDGFPIRSETTTTMMGKPFKSWQELKSLENREPARGFYEPPAGYQETKFDPMAQGQQGRRR